MVEIIDKDLEKAPVVAGEGEKPREIIGGTPGAYNINPSIGGGIDKKRLKRIKSVDMKIRGIDVRRKAKNIDNSQNN